MEPHASPLATGPITASQLQSIYASDQEMYPAPLPFARLQSWVDACPELWISFYPTKADAAAAQDPVGVVVVLPLLRQHWGDLLVGKVKEIDIHAGRMFPSGDDGDDGVVEVGLHVFHVERFGQVSEGSVVSERAVGMKRGFAEMAIAEAVGRVKVASQESRMARWNMCGLSALVATEAGKRTFARMGFTRTGYREIFVRDEIVDEEDPEINMVCIYPGQNEEMLKRWIVPGQDVVVSGPSEMVVKYL